ncbi:MAG TPA: asparagine synthase (glutamine-hydrolyzing) [Rhodanobacteraceae bacterium]|nr:asparagine synthase (glutamine-hydrolyzing) [Rhodanobacteraceae bacterium]
MCGIAGLLYRGDEALPAVTRMLDRLAHRGPDDAGTWHEPASGLTLGHRRLSIIDLSPAGHQPMASASGRLVLTYNGEIYNHAELRRTLDSGEAATEWRGHSDTEALLAACEAWGIEAALQRCNGMFAFAVWDTQTRTLTLARDRMGEKPLYFGWVAGRFAFASELKAFEPLPGWSPRMHAPAITSFLRTGYVHGSESAVAGIFRLPAGCLLRLSLAELQAPRDWTWLSPRVTRYWSLSEVAANGEAHPLTDAAEATSRLESLLSDAVAMRMSADVPLGAFLSGGIDSSLITALMQAQSNQPVRSFSIGFHEQGFDEAAFARAVARHLGTRHTELYVDAPQAVELIPTLAHTFDEPFADFSQLPTLLVSRMTRQHVTVALSGDGGDELFAGYGRYFAILKLWRLLQPLPVAARRAAGFACHSAATLLAPVAGMGQSNDSLSFRCARLAERLAVPDLDVLRLAFIGSAGYARVLRGRAGTFVGSDTVTTRGEALRRLMFGDQVDYLPDDILHKVDRAAMAHGLETRVPLLDHRVVELSWRFATLLLTQGGQGKQPLRRMLEKHVPRALFDRPKQGFAPPMDAWLRGPLREWAASRLTEHVLREMPMLDADAVLKLWHAHCNGRLNGAPLLWNVLMLADWRERFKASF